MLEAGGEGVEAPISQKGEILTNAPCEVIILSLTIMQVSPFVREFARFLKQKHFHHLLREGGTSLTATL